MKRIFATECLYDGLLALTAGIAVVGVLKPADARVIQINITTIESPTFGGASFGSVGQYERIEGTITGEVDPRNPLNSVIVDIGLATPKNANGTVGYSADFQILRPIDLNKGNHRVLFDLPNRGRATSLTTLNDTKTANDTTTSGSPGNGFLMNQGYTIVEGAWDITAQQGATPETTLFGVTFPIAKNKDGSTITGPATEEFVIDKNATAASEPLTYAAASADKSKGFLTVQENYGDTPQLVPSTGWDYTDGTLKAVKLTSGNFGGPGSFGPTALYEFTYIARDPIIAGLGFAALRDSRLSCATQRRMIRALPTRSPAMCSISTPPVFPSPAAPRAILCCMALTKPSSRTRRSTMARATR